MGIGDSDDKKGINIKLESCCDVCTNLKVPIKQDIKAYYDNKAIDIKQEPWCGICNNLKVSIKLETTDSTSRKPENEIVDYENLNLDDAVNKQHVNQLLSKGM